MGSSAPWKSSSKDDPPIAPTAVAGSEPPAPPAPPAPRTPSTADSAVAVGREDAGGNHRWTAPRLLPVEAEHPPPPVRLRVRLLIRFLFEVPPDEHPVVHLYVRRRVLEQRQPRSLLRVGVLETALPGDDRDEQPGLALLARGRVPGEFRDVSSLCVTRGVSQHRRRMKPRRARPDERDAPDHQRRARDDPREKAATPPMLIMSIDDVRGDALLDVPEFSRRRWTRALHPPRVARAPEQRRGLGRAPLNHGAGR